MVLSPQPREAIIINVPQQKASTDKGWAEGAASIASVLAWPLTLALLLIFFRAPITRFIDRLRAFKGPGVEMSTETMIEQELPIRTPPLNSPETNFYLSPIDTIVTAWVNVEKAARDAVLRAKPISQVGTRGLPYSTVLRNVDALEQGNFLDNPAVRPLIRDLAKIRNQAVHRPDEPISHEALSQFVANADWAVARLQEVRPS